jgi:small subunit ribosomal protein S3
LKRGSIPLQTFRADIDFKRERATLSYGVVGIKVWIYRGKIFADKNKFSPKADQPQAQKTD